MNLLIIVIVLIASGFLGYWIWKKVEDAIIEAEINRIKIPDDESQPPPAEKPVEKPQEKNDQRKTV